MENQEVELVGTEKQILWAKKIRLQKINEFKSDLKRIEAEQKKVPSGSEYFKKCEMWIESAKADLKSFTVATSAKWIIDNRF